MATRFVPEEIVPFLHADLIRRYGGRYGLRDPGLLSSALAQPKTTGAGKHLHRTIFDKAAAYGYHLSRNHPFVDGNKRIAFVVMDIFLQMNGWQIDASEEEAYSTISTLAAGSISKPALAKWLKAHCSRLSE
ncbi:MAG: type II toxin-antitoxin system death-on-curing family toxin [Candidatus Eisenbacteria bacterium]